MKFKLEFSAGGVVFKKDKNKTLWLITQHSQHKGWGFPKGLIGDVNKNEDKKVAALREVAEEGGIKAKIVSDQPVKIHYNYRQGEFFVKKTVYYFLMEYISGDPKDHDWEVAEARFATEHEARQTLSFKSDKEALEKILEEFKKR